MVKTKTILFRDAHQRVKIMLNAWFIMDTRIVVTSNGGIQVVVTGACHLEAFCSI